MSEPAVLMVGTALASRGGISSVITLYAEAGLFERVRYLASYTDGSPLRKILHYLVFLPQFCWTLWRHPGIRVVHFHSASRMSFFRKSFAWTIARLLGKKTVFHIHGAEFHLFYDRSPAFLQAIIRGLLRRTDVIIALSRQWQADLFRISGNPNIRVIYNPTVVKEPVPAVKNAPVRFLFMGRLGKRKGVYDIIESACRVKSGNVRIMLYGDGEVEDILARVKALGVEDKVAVGGWISGRQKEEMFRQASVLLLPSYHEGLPISVLEAMSYGKPVLATHVGGIPEAVHDGVNGFLLPPGECDELARRIDELAASEELRERMGREGHAIAREKFDLPVIIRQLETLYDELADSSSRCV